MLKRKSGILYPIQSFFSNQKYDVFIGDWGNLRVIDYVKQMGFKVLQILPVNPICRISFSPYSGNSAFGFDYCFISIDKLIKDGLIEESEVNDIIKDYEIPKDLDKIYYSLAFDFKIKTLEKCYRRNFNLLRNKLDEFINLNSWVKLFAMYCSMKELQGNKPWYEWDNELKYFEDAKIQDLDRFYFYVFIQFICNVQYLEFKRYANENGILIFGDIPIYVSHDSVDVWANRDIFSIDDKGYPEFVAGVPPDYFSETGQLWGNPVYNWHQLQKQNFKWWIDRLNFCFNIYDWVRIDHFRGLVAFWSVKYGEKTAINGQWVEAKPYEFFDTLLDYRAVLPIIAEDLGVITPDVDLVRERYGIPGMRVLQFAFSDPSNIHLPHNYSPNTVAYTGTHDNNTTKGWFKNENINKHFLQDYLQKFVDENNITDELIKLLLSSPANLVIVPIQDILNLDERYRMNTPGSNQNNWIYRDNILVSKLDNLIPRFYELNNIYKRR